MNEALEAIRAGDRHAAAIELLVAYQAARSARARRDLALAAAAVDSGRWVAAVSLVRSAARTEEACAAVG